MEPNHIPEESPPPYAVHASDVATASSSHYTQDVTYHLQQHLASLPRHIRSTQEAHSVQQSLDDSYLLDLLVPEIEQFLAHLADLPTTPRLAQLTLVPHEAVPPRAILSGMEDMRRRGELCQITRVKPRSKSGEKEKQKPSSDHSQDASDEPSWSTGQEFSDWGRFGEPSSSTGTDLSRKQNLLWWIDEDMARRLARILQPNTTSEKEPVALQTPVQEAVEQPLPAKKEKKGWLWGRKSSNSSSTFATKTVETEVNAVPARFNATPPPPGPGKKPQEGARMFVSAEEVAFRSENDFGIVESLRGWAVVVTVQVRT